MSITAKTGFSLHSADGTVLAHEEHFEMALGAMRRIDGAESVRRVEDDVLCATKCRVSKPRSRGVSWHGVGPLL